VFLTGTHGVTAARPTNRDLHPASDFDGPPFDVLIPLSTEFFVEWQVAENDGRGLLNTAPDK
jgi:hypothetical protein